MPYRLPAAVRQWAIEKPESYFVRFGHGRNGSPELYSGGPTYLISAGGVNRGWRCRSPHGPSRSCCEMGLEICAIVPPDGPRTLDEMEHTGVCNRFACSNGALNVPKNKQRAHRRAIGPCSMIGSDDLCLWRRPALLAVFPD